MAKNDKLITIFETKTGIVVAEIIGEYKAERLILTAQEDDCFIIRVFHSSYYKLPKYIYTGEFSCTTINFEDSKYYRMAKVVADTLDKSEKIRHYAKMVG